ncbi:MAG: hypothetical protein QNJ98_08765 [Planctomycetota bacterium]|nr:hypothetical protein [Planctomycetota bacterium]
MTRLLRSLLVLLLAAGFVLSGARADEPLEKRDHIEIRGIYGGMPKSLIQGERRLVDAGVNAIWIGERGITKAAVATARAQGVKLFAEFNTVHRAEYLKDHPDAAPVGTDGKRAPAPHGWQGICPTHVAYRAWRMRAFWKLLATYEIDGVWLDYHHAHSSWERAEPALPDTCFCERCLAQFQKDTRTDLDGATGAAAAKVVLGKHKQAWVTWRCAVFTDWVREFKAILKAVRPKALLGTFHCPWSLEEREGALREKLAIDLRAQKAYVDVFSPMPYHARFGYAKDPAWISRQTAWLGRHLGVKGVPGESVRIWPIVQLSDWGEAVPVEQVIPVIDHGTRRPATGVMVFAWGRLRKSPPKVAALSEAYRAIGR